MTKGFFDIEELPKQTEVGTYSARSRIPTCQACKQLYSCARPKAPAVGKGEKRILVIGGPVTRAYENNEAMGSGYEFLKRAMSYNDISLEKDCWYTFAIKCFSAKKKKANKTTIAACHRKLMEEIRELKPAVIVPTTSMAWEVLLYDRLAGRANTKYSSYCGFAIPDQKLRTWIIPIYATEFMLKLDAEDKKWNPYKLFYDRQLKSILAHIDKPVPVFKDNVVCVTDEAKATELLEQYAYKKRMAFDYETTGLKPYRKGHEILCVSFADGKTSWAFPMFKSPRFLAAYRVLMETAPTKLIAHNAAFEKNWTKVILDIEPKNVTMDSMLLAHSYRNNIKTGLKFLVYAFYGVLGYDNEVDDYIDAPLEERKKYGSNAFNRLKSLPIEKLLYYNGLDSQYTYWLYDDMFRELDEEHQFPGYKLQNNLFAPTLYRVQTRGMCLDVPNLLKWEKELTDKAIPHLQKIQNDELINKTWDLPQRFNPASDYHVRRLVFTLLKYKPEFFTDKGQPAVDAEALASLRNELPILNNLYQYKRYTKAANSFLKQYEREMNDDGRVRTVYNLQGVKTFRVSSNSPNLLNCPSRDKEIKKKVKGVICAAPGHILVNCDLKAAEVAMAAIISGDKNLQSFANDPNKDMHSGLAAELFMMEQDEVPKRLRSPFKMFFTFKQFYGSYYKQCAETMWRAFSAMGAAETYDMDVLEHLKKKGCNTYEKFEKRCQDLEHTLWYDWFPGYRQWREITFDFFKKHGYVDYAIGMRYYGPASRNEVLNAPIQGTSFCMLATLMTWMDMWMAENKMESFLFAQVYDSLSFSVAPDEEKAVMNELHEFLHGGLQKAYPFTKDVQLIMEKEKSTIEKNSWADLDGDGYV